MSLAQVIFTINIYYKGIGVGYYIIYKDFFRIYCEVFNASFLLSILNNGIVIFYFSYLCKYR